MPSKTLGNLMRTSTIAAAICGLFLGLFVILTWGRDIIQANPEFTDGSGCYIWKVSSPVIRETVFTVKTANWVKTGAVLLLGVLAAVLSRYLTKTAMLQEESEGTL